jgi:hypothetical protein
VFKTNKGVPEEQREYFAIRRVQVNRDGLK